MALSLADLIAQKDALDRQISEVQTAAKAEALATIRQLMAAHGLSVADLAVTQPKKAGGANAGVKVPPKFRDPASGATWSGRGLKPKWLVSAIEGGKSLEEFAI